MKTSNVINLSKRTKGTYVAGNYNNPDYMDIECNGIRICSVLLENEITTREEAEANATFIVQACNNYDSLVQAIKNIVSMNGVGYKDAQKFSDDLQPLINEAKQLLNQLNAL